MPEPVEPTESQAALLKAAIVAKAVRLLNLPGSPFGVAGEGEWGYAIKPDYAINEMLYGLRYKSLDISDVEVEAGEVIAAMGTTEQDWHGNTEQVDLALLAARAWVDEALLGLGVA